MKYNIRIFERHTVASMNRTIVDPNRVLNFTITEQFAEYLLNQ